MSTLKEKNQNHIFTITTELDPPKSASSAITEEQAQKVAPYVDAVNIADCPMAKMRMSPIALSCIIQQKYQVESIFHLTCRDRNVIGLQAELLGAAALGVHNILTLTGDPPKIGDHPNAKGVFEIDSTGLIQIASCLNSGHDIEGHDLGAATDFYIGTTGNPGTDDLDAEIKRLEGKKKAGAQFIQTQPIYDIKQAEDFLACAKDLDLPILFGIVPLKSFKMANYLNDKVPGITIPAKVLSQMETGGRETGLAISKEIVTALREIQNGRKRSHWIWYIFPQVAGLGMSSTSQYYAISGLDEARAYLREPTLRAHLLEISNALLALDESDPSVVFGFPDDLKLRSSMTLFAAAAPDEPVFAAVLDKFFDGRPDTRTLQILGL